MFTNYKELTLFYFRLQSLDYISPATKWVLQSYSFMLSYYTGDYYTIF